MFRISDNDEKLEAFMVPDIKYKHAASNNSGRELPELRDASQRFLQMYRSTPHSATAVSPHSAMHGGKVMRTVLPLMTPNDHVLDRT